MDKIKKYEGYKKAVEYLYNLTGDRRYKKYIELYEAIINALRED